MTGSHAETGAGRWNGMEHLAHTVARWATPARFGWTAAGIIALLGVLGILDTAGAIDAPVLDLDREYNIPPIFSAALLSCAAVFAAFYGAVRVDKGPQMRPAALLAVLFLFMSADEFGQIHERLEDATGIDFEVLYAPLVAACGVAWLLVLRRLWPRVGPRLLLMGGAAAWVVAQALEDLQWHDDIGNGVHANGYEVMMVIEELLEMAGTWMFCLALLIPVAAAAAEAGRSAAPLRGGLRNPSGAVDQAEECAEDLGEVLHEDHGRYPQPNGRPVTPRHGAR